MGNQVMAIPLGKLVWEWGYGGERWDFIGILVATGGGFWYNADDKSKIKMQKSK